MSCCAIANSTDFSSPRKLALRQRQRLHLILADADSRIVGGRQRLQIEPRSTGAQRHPAAGAIDGQHCVVRQRAQQVLQLARRDGYRLRFLAREIRMRGDLHLEIGRRDEELAVPVLDQDIRENWQRVAAFDDARHRLQGFQQRVAGDLF